MLQYVGHFPNIALQTQSMALTPSSDTEREKYTEYENNAHTRLLDKSNYDVLENKDTSRSPCRVRSQCAEVWNPLGARVTRVSTWLHSQEIISHFISPALRSRVMEVSASYDRKNESGEGGRAAERSRQRSGG